MGLSSRISGYTNCNYRQVGSIFETSFDLTTAEPGFFAVTLTNEDELRPHNCHIEIQKSNKVAEQRSGPITVNIGSVILSIGLALAVMGLRFIMVKNSLKGGKPLDERLKTLKKEFLAFLIAGGAIFLIGILGPYLALSVEISKVFANAGGVIFGLGIPQYTQWKYGQGTDAQVKESLKRVKKWTYLTLVLGVALIIISGFISV